MAEEARKAGETAAQEATASAAEAAAKAEKISKAAIASAEKASAGAEKADKEAKEASAQLYEKAINLVLMPPVDVLQTQSLEKELHQVQNLRVLLTSGSADRNVRIVVSAEQPIPLADVLSQIPIVEQVAKKGKDLQISLKARA